MPSVIVDKNYLNRAEIILDDAIQGIPILSISRKKMPLPIGADKTMEFESVVVECNDGRNGYPQNVPVFFTSAPLQTDSVFFSIHTSVLMREGWEHHAIEKSLNEVKKYAKLLSCF